MAVSVNAVVQAPDPYSARLVGSRSAAADQEATPSSAANPPAAAANPPVAIQMRQALQTRTVSSELFSTLMTQDGRSLRMPSAAPATGQSGLIAMRPSVSLGSRQARASWQAWSTARAPGSWQDTGTGPAQGSWQARGSSPGVQAGPAGGDSLATIRVAEDIIQAASAGPPTAEGRRIAAEAFLMEAQAQRDFVSQQAQGMAGRRQWMA